MNNQQLRELLNDAWGIIENIRHDDEPCQIDCVGACQSHGWPYKEPECPHARIGKLAKVKALMEENEQHLTQGTWPADCLQRAFVEGAAWWQFHHNGSTMFSSERHEAEAEAVRKYGEPEKESGAV